MAYQNPIPACGCKRRKVWRAKNAFAKSLTTQWGARRTPRGCNKKQRSAHTRHTGPLSMSPAMPTATAGVAVCPCFYSQTKRHKVVVCWGRGARHEEPGPNPNRPTHQHVGLQHIANSCSRMHDGDNDASINSSSLSLIKIDIRCKMDAETMPLRHRHAARKTAPGLLELDRISAHAGP